MNLEKTLSLVGNVYLSDQQTRQTLEEVSLASYGLSRLFTMDSQIPAATSNLPVDFGSATFAELFFARVDIPDGGDCSFKLKFASLLSPAAWVDVTTYSAGDVVSYGGASYASLAGSNVGNLPTDAGSWLPLAVSVDPTTTTEVTVPCNGGEIWCNKTQLLSAKINSISGCNVQIIGGGRS